jgi:hypothetical protein
VLTSLLQQIRSKLALDANDHMRNLYLGILSGILNSLVYRLHGERQSIGPQ